MSETTLGSMTAERRGPAATYDAVQRALHWLTAILFLLAVAIGLYASLQAPGTSPRRELLEIHKSLGMTIFFLAWIRLAYRLMVRPPAYPASFSRFVRWASGINHWILYGLMLAMPATGYMFSAAGGYPLRYFWLFDWPRLLPKDKAVALLGQNLHGLLAWLVYAVVALHILAVLWHELVKRDGTLSRMRAPRR